MFQDDLLRIGWRVKGVTSNNLLILNLNSMNNKPVAVIMLPTKTIDRPLLFKYVKRVPAKRTGNSEGNTMSEPIEIGDLRYSKYHDGIQDDIRQAQYLYFISDEEVKEGDNGKWCYWNDNVIDKYTGGKCEYGNPKVIIASTDPSLKLPSIPEEWIRTKYVPSNGAIKEVRLEMYNTQEHSKCYGAIEQGEWKLKLTSNNEVIIADEPVEEDWRKSIEKVKKGINDHLEGKTPNIEISTEGTTLPKIIRSNS